MLSNAPLDSYGRTIHELLELQKRQGWHAERGAGWYGCEDPDCPDWIVSHGAWWEHSHHLPAEAVS